jgi:hypothetical protein
MRRTPVLLATALGAVALAGPVAAMPAGSTSAELLPDLDPAPPAGLVVQSAADGAARRFRLGFVSRVGNVGAGPLVLKGSRPSAGDSVMVASQVVELAGGGISAIADVGRFEYVAGRSHQHWHLLRFMTYELRRARGFRLVVPDRKTGFCLGDRYDVDPATTLPGEPPDRVYNTNCGPEQPDLLEIEEGISVGWGDVYEAWRDGQYLDVTGLPAGRYVLVHRVNAGRPLLESSYANDASSALVSLTWPHGRHESPRVRLLAICPQTARCPAPR